MLYIDYVFEFNRINYEVLINKNLYMLFLIILFLSIIKFLYKKKFRKYLF